jgi:hypothetical protein
MQHQSVGILLPKTIRLKLWSERTGRLPARGVTGRISEAVHSVLILSQFLASDATEYGNDRLISKSCAPVTASHPETWGGRCPLAYFHRHHGESAAKSGGHLRNHIMVHASLLA